jgi:hypothetical protein
MFTTQTQSNQIQTFKTRNQREIHDPSIVGYKRVRCVGEAENILEVFKSDNSNIVCIFKAIPTQETQIKIMVFANSIQGLKIRPISSLKYDGNFTISLEFTEPLSNQELQVLAAQFAQAGNYDIQNSLIEAREKMEKINKNAVVESK